MTKAIEFSKKYEKYQKIYLEVKKDFFTLLHIGEYNEKTQTYTTNRRNTVVDKKSIVFDTKNEMYEHLHKKNIKNGYEWDLPDNSDCCYDLSSDVLSYY